MSISESYGFRVKTIKKHEDFRNKEYKAPSGRKILGTEPTATIMKGDGHDCFEVDKELAFDKVQRRIFGHLFRCCVSYFLECQTWRGKTELQGESSTCGGCNGSHWCLTPNLCDDKMTRVIEQIKLQKIDPILIRYLENTIGLTAEEQQFLKDNAANPMVIDSFFMKRVSHKQLTRSYADSIYEAQANSTIENPDGSNMMDNRFEAKLRKDEDANCQKCFQQTLKPLDSVKEFIQLSSDFYKKAIIDLTTRKQEISRFIELNQAIELFVKNNTPTQTEFIDFVKNIDELLKLRQSLVQHIDGAPSLKQVDHVRADYHWLKQIVSFATKTSDTSQVFDFYTATKKYLKPSNVDGLISHLKRYDVYLEEVRSQAFAASFFSEKVNLDGLVLFYFGVRQENGERRMPTRDELISYLIDMTKKQPIPAKNKRSLKEEKNIVSSCDVDVSSLDVDFTDVSESMNLSK